MKFYKILLVCAALSIANFHIHAEVLPNDSVFLKCTDWYRLGEDADQIELKQKLFIVIPDRFLYTLDDNLNWVKRRTTVDLDEYFVSVGMRYYRLNRSNLRMRISYVMDIWGEYDCEITTSQEMSTIVSSIKESKKSKQKL